MKAIKYIFEHKILCIVILLLMVINSVLSFSIPYLTRDIINIGIAEGRIDFIINQGLIMLIITITLAVSCYIYSIFSDLLTKIIGRDLRTRIYHAVVNFPEKTINKYSESSLIIRSTNDIEHIQKVIVLIIGTVFNAPIIIITSLYFAIRTIPQLWWLPIIIAISIIIAAMLLVKKTAPIFGKMQFLFDKINLISRENISGALIAKSFNNANFENERFDVPNKNLFNTQYKLGKIMGIITPLLNLGFSGLSILLLFIGSFFINSGWLKVGEVVAFTEYSINVAAAFSSLGMLIGSLPRANIVYKRINDVIQESKKNKDLATKEPSTHIINKNNYVLEFLNVSFKYENNNSMILDNLSFKINKGETFAITGDIGSGKTTLLKLINNLLQPSSGKILLNNINISEYNGDDYKALFAYTPQDSFLFSGTIKDNINYGIENDQKKYNEKYLMQFIEASCASDFINEENESLSKNISQDSFNISGGQKQRLSIARSLASNKEILIFDDCFTAIDYKTENQILSNIDRLTKQKTKIIVSSRISNIINADKILVLDEGKQVGLGTHSQLISNCTEYLKIVKAQSMENAHE